MLEPRVWFSDRKTPESFEIRLQTIVIMQNKLTLWDQVKINHSFRSDLMEKQIKNSVFGAIVQDVYQWGNKSQKKGVMN